MVNLRHVPGNISPHQQYYGKYRGRVVDNVDEKEMGRLQVEVPAIAPNTPLGWAMPCVPFAGNGIGLYLIPAVGALVWVEFEGGNLSYPIWTGCFWATGQLPKGAEPGVFLLQTEGGNKIKLIDTGEVIEITNKSGAVINMTGDTITIDSGGTKIVLDSKAVMINDGSLEVT